MLKPKDVVLQIYNIALEKSCACFIDNANID